ncbi:hypothetical protein ACSBR2_002164 [Camellia fascicularis]
MMMMEWKTHIHRLWSINKTTFFCYYCCIISSIFFLSTACSFLGTTICIKTTTCSGGISFPLAGKVDFYYVQEFEMVLEKMNGQEILASSKGNKREASSSLKLGGGTRRFLRGPGSSPPQCMSKCGTCTPCKPVHVAVPPPGTPVTAEYYPEAWRCKCGNKLYKP